MSSCNFSISFAHFA
uniref:Uncharacterized protein n=1 Tax=Arundo donax TaxID=35708 RepID=A0A0A9CFL3_ARUDO